MQGNPFKDVDRKDFGLAITLSVEPESKEKEASTPARRP